MTSAAVDDPDCMHVRPKLVAGRRLDEQIEWVVEACGDCADAARDVVDEWLERLGYGDARSPDRLNRLRLHAEQATALDRWHASLVRALVLRPAALVLHCAPQAPERAAVDAMAAQLRQRYPLHEFSVSDEP